MDHPDVEPMVGVMASGATNGGPSAVLDHRFSPDSGGWFLHFFPMFRPNCRIFGAAKKNWKWSSGVHFHLKISKKMVHFPSHIKTLMNLETRESRGPPFQAH
jgi:hypothetical protein